jgi:large subunit ribosomal protein L16
VAVVKPGRVIFEVEGCTQEIAEEAFHRAHHKLPVGTHLIKRESPL